MSNERHEPSLAERTREALAEHERIQKAREKVAQESIYDHIPEGVKEKMALARNIKSAFNAVAEGIQNALHYTGPIGHSIMKIGSWAKDVAEFSMFERENGEFKLDADGGRIFSGRRLAKAFAVAACLGLSANLGYHYTYYHSTQFNELVYTTGKQEIVDGELYHVTGCTSLPCSTDADNGKYYQIEKSYFWPRQIYPEENVYANIPNQIAACEIQGYGIYFKQLKPIFKWAEWYQNIESVSCRPLSENEIQKLMEPPIAPTRPDAPNLSHDSLS